MTNQAVLMRAGCALAMLLATEALLRYARTRAFSPAVVSRLAWCAWWLTRPLLASIVFLILRVPLRSDAEHYYLPQAQAALAGGLVYRDFPSSYGPLFPYLAAGVIALGTSPLAFVATAIGCEALAIKLWLRAPPSIEAPRAEGFLAYACTPFVIWDVTVEGHNQAWISAGLALAIALGSRGGWFAAGLVVALTTAGVKLLVLAFAPVLLACAGRPLRFVLGVAALALVTPLFFFGADPSQPLDVQSAYWTSGNLPFVLAGLWPSLLSPRLAGVRMAVVLLVLLGVALAARARAGRARSELPAIEAALCLGGFAFLLVSSKAYAHYAVIAWLPACFLLSRDGFGARQRAFVYALGFLVTIEPALWFHALEQRTLEEALAGAFSTPTLGIFVVVELALLGAYAGLLRAAWLGLVPSKAP